MLDLNEILVHLEVLRQLFRAMRVFRDLVVHPRFYPVPVPAAGVGRAFQSQQISQQTAVLIIVSDCIDDHLYSLDNCKVIGVVSVVVNVLT